MEPPQLEQCAQWPCSHAHLVFQSAPLPAHHDSQPDVWALDESRQSVQPEHTRADQLHLMKIQRGSGTHARVS